MADPRGTVRTKVKVEGSDESVKNLKNIERSFDTLGKGLGGVEKIARSSGAEVAAGLAAIGAASVALGALVGGVKALASGLHELGMRGGDVSAVATAFERIANPRLLAQMHAVTGGLVRDMDLMRLSNEALRSGLVGDRELTRWMSVTTRAAQDMGRNVGQSLQAVTTAISGGGTEALAQLGVNMSRVRDQMREMGRSMESEAGLVQAIRLAMDQLNEDLGAVDNSAGNLNDAWTAIDVTFNNWLDSMARSFSQNPQLIRFFVDLNSELEVLATNAEGLGGSIGDLSAALIEVTVGSGRDFVQMITLLATGVVNFTIAMGNAHRAMLMWEQIINPIDWITQLNAERIQRIDDNIAGLNRLRDSMDAVAGAVDRLESRRDAIDRLRRDGVLGGGAGSGPQSRPGEVGIEDFGVGGGALEAAGQESRNRRLANEVEAAARRRAAEANRARGGGRRGVSAADSLAEQEEKLAQTAAHALAEINRLREAELVIAEKLAGQDADRLATLNREREMREEIYQKQIEAQEAEEAFLDRIKQAQEEIAAADRARREEHLSQFQGVIDAAGQAMDAVSSLYNQIGALREAQAEAAYNSAIASGQSEEQAARARKKSAEEGARAEGKFLVAYNSVMAVVETAAAIADFAGQQYVSGAMHLVSAATYGVAAATAAAQLGGGTPTAAPTAGSFSASEPENVAPADTGGGSITIVNQYSLGRTEAGLGEKMGEAQWARTRSGRPSGNPGTVNYGV